MAHGAELNEVPPEREAVSIQYGSYHARIPLENPAQFLNDLISKIRSISASAAR
jgi:hypothetical protein